MQIIPVGERAFGELVEEWCLLLFQLFCGGISGLLHALLFR
jgi:hypothetical protein